MRILVITILSSVMLTSLGLTSSAQVTALSRHGAAIKRTADSLRPHDRIRVSPLQGKREFGEYLSSNAESLTLYDVESDSENTLQYEQIKKIKIGYGDYNPITRRHSGPLSPVAFAVFLAVFLGVVVGLAAAAK